MQKSRYFYGKNDKYKNLQKINFKKTIVWKERFLKKH